MRLLTFLKTLGGILEDLSDDEYNDGDNIEETFDDESSVNGNDQSEHTDDKDSVNNEEILLEVRHCVSRIMSTTWSILQEDCGYGRSKETNSSC